MGLLHDIVATAWSQAATMKTTGWLCTKDVVKGDSGLFNVLTKWHENTNELYGDIF